MKANSWDFPADEDKFDRAYKKLLEKFLLWEVALAPCLKDRERTSIDALRQRILQTGATRISDDVSNLLSKLIEIANSAKY